MPSVDMLLVLVLHRKADQVELTTRELLLVV
jgi:hypothetical protein